MSPSNKFDRLSNEDTSGEEFQEIERLLQQLRTYEGNPPNSKVTKDLEYLRNILSGNLPRNLVLHITPVLFGSLQYNDPSPEGPDSDVLFIGDGKAGNLWWTANNGKLKESIYSGWPEGKRRDFDIRFVSISHVRDDYEASIILSGKPLYNEDLERLDRYRGRIGGVLALNSQLREGVLFTLRDTLDIRQAR